MAASFPYEVINGHAMTMMEAALAYARAGWDVFPCVSSREGKKPKAPLTAHGLKDATADEGRICEWWRQWPDAAIGLPMGQHRVIAIDCDLDKQTGEPAGQQELLAYLGGLKDYRLATVWQVTPSGGCQYLFEVPDGMDPDAVKNAVKNIPGLAHCDVRATGGYIVAAPSTLGPYDHAPKGGRYVWQDGLAWIQAMPKALYELLAKKSQGRRPSALPVQAPRAPQVSTRERQYAENGIRGAADEYGQTPAGGRNNAQNDLMLRAYRLALAGNVDEQIVYNAFRAAAERNGYIQSDGVAAFNKTAESARRKAIQQGPADIPKQSSASMPTSRTPAPAQAEPEEPRREEGGLAILPPPQTPPRGIFPAQLEAAVADVADKMGGGQYALALGPCLAAMAAAVGGKRKAAVKQAGPQPANIWMCVLGGTGAGKSPCADPFIEPLQASNTDAYNKWEEDYKEKKKAQKDYQRRAKNHTLKENEEEPELPPYPPMIKMGDTTLEALGQNFKAFRDNGMTPSTSIFSDEIRNGLKSLDCYSGGKEGGGLTQLLSLYDGNSWDNSRINERRNFTLPHCFLTIFGGLQTTLAPTVFTEEQLNSGQLGRFMFVRGEPPMVAQWNDEDLSAETRKAISTVLAYLLKLEDAPQAPFSPDGPMDMSMPCDVIHLADEAREVMRMWYEEQYRLAATEGWLGMFSKLSKQSSRLALLIHLANQAFLPPEQRELRITADTMRKAFKLTAYFKHTLEEVWMLAKAGSAVKALEPVHRKAAQIFLNHWPEIQALNFTVPNEQILAWLNAALPAKVTGRALQNICTPLLIQPLNRLVAHGKRGRSFSEGTYAVLLRATGRGL